ncbi:MAG: choice-of-anchor D domain-containing protein [Actinomycetota bacterium]
MRRAFRWVLVPLLVMVPAVVAFATAHVSVTPSNVSFPTQCTHSAAASQRFVLTNDGDTQAQGVSVSVSPSPMASVFPLGGQTSSGGLDPGASMQVQVGFVPQRVGKNSASAVVTYVEPAPSESPGNGGGGGGPPSPPPSPTPTTTSIPLAGTAIDRFLAVDPLALNFGSVHTRKPGPTKTLTIFDDGDSPLTIGRIFVGGREPGDFTLGKLSASKISDGHPATITISFKPRGVGARAADLIIHSNSCDSPTTTVQLAGIAVEQDIKLTPPKVDFGAVTVGTPATQHLLVVNQGGAPLKLVSIGLASHDPGSDDVKHFTLQGKPKLPRIMQPGHAIQLTLLFDAAETGPKNVDVKIVSDDPDTPKATVSVFAAAEVKPTPTPTESAAAGPPPSSGGSGFHVNLGPYVPEMGIGLAVVGFFWLLITVRRRRGIPE